MTKSVPSRNNSTDRSGLLVVQYFAPEEFFILDGNAEASTLLGTEIEKLRGRELEEMWPHARSTGLMRCLFAAMKNEKSFETTIGVHKVGTNHKLIRVKGRPISGDRLLLSFLEVADHDSVRQET